MIAFNPETGLLTAPRATLAALAAICTGGEDDAATDDAAMDRPATDDAAMDRAATDRAATDRAAMDRPATDDAASVDAALASAGAGSLAEPHPKLAEALAPMRRPMIGIQLAKSGYLMPGWVGDGRFTLHVFRHGDDDQLVPMPAEALVHFLLWLLDIGPRPRDPRPPETAVDGSALDRAVALRLADRPSEGVLPEPLDTAIAHGFRDWWLASSRWTPAPGARGEISLEGIDTDAGLWSVQRFDDGGAIVRPVTPLSTMLALGDLLPDNDLIDADARLAPEATPVRGGAIAWVFEALAR